jgi:hypothetical protein
MADYIFSPNERHAVFTVHGETCYLCGALLNMKTMEVDHIIPESLLKEPEKLANVLKLLGRPADFKVNSYANWLPACRSCNGKKRAKVFDPAPIVLILLQNAAEKADRAEKIAARTVADAELYEALNRIQRASKLGELKDDFKAAMKPLVEFQIAVREPELAKEPVRLTPLYEVISEGGGITIIRGPYGVGGRPSSPHAHSSFDCPNCGSIAAWNGARCVICGEMSED